MQDSKIGRRQLLKGALLTAVGAQALKPDASHAADLVKLTEADPMAKALAYHADAKKVDAKAFPTYKAGQRCETCAQIQAGTGSDRGCNLFAGKSVSINGWCKVWVPKT